MSKRKRSNSGLTPDKRSWISQPEPSEEDVTGEVGIIESISLKNFMCHSFLGPIVFGPNVNFVVGNNGSGKSAILTALIVALGGKALTTNRGSSFKEFVKEGESSADVSITLRNRGDDAYKPEVFGQSIIVDLRISSEGIPTYKLRSKTGHLVSSEKEELVCILDHFNIQVDNPVCILTQDMSKHFLHSTEGSNKYKFFMKATQLGQMKEVYSYTRETKTMTQNTVEKHKETLQELKRKYHEKEEIYKILASLNEMQQKLDVLKNQMAWALVTEVEQEMKTMRELIAAEEKSTNDQKVEEWEGKFQEANRTCRELQDQLEGAALRMQQLQPQCAELKNQAQACSQVHKTTEDKDQLNKQIREVKHSISQSNSADTRADVERTNHIQADLEDQSCRYLSIRCKYYFDSMLSQRGYTGKITFDHKKETLSLSVQPGEGGKADLTDMRSLSGGERSFSTVCFLLSLWAIAEAPFRALDAFDVDMDVVNRRISMDMMLKIAASQRYRQFIFLMPQSMSSFPVNNLIRFIHLKDPDRSQSDLPFTQRNLK